MISKIQFLFMAAVLLGTVSLLGSLRPLHPTASYLLTGVPIMAAELTLALCFARGTAENVFARTNGGGWIYRILSVLVVLVAGAMVPTVTILFVNQALDRAQSVERTLPVTRTYSSIHRGSTTYYAVVQATSPPRWLFASFGSQDDIRLPRDIWQRIVPGQSTLTLTIHPGRIGLPWYDIVNPAG